MSAAFRGYNVRLIRSNRPWRGQRHRVRLESRANGQVLLASEHYRDRSDAATLALNLVAALHGMPVGVIIDGLEVDWRELESLT